MMPEKLTPKEFTPEEIERIKVAFESARKGAIEAGEFRYIKRLNDAEKSIASYGRRRYWTMHLLPCWLGKIES